jgi:hypothetical protein
MMLTQLNSIRVRESPSFTRPTQPKITLNSEYKKLIHYYVRPSGVESQELTDKTVLLLQDSKRTSHPVLLDQLLEFSFTPKDKTELEKFYERLDE